MFDSWITHGQEKSKIICQFIMKAVISSKWLLVSSQILLQDRLDCFSFLQNERLKHFKYFGKNMQI